jgi:TonB family protein
MLLRVSRVAVALAVAAAVPAAAQTITPRAWPAPVYPQIAQNARIQGDVEVAVDVRPDGTVAGARVVKGPPLLQDAVMEATKAATFACRDCSAPSVQYTLYVTFRLVDPADCVAKKPPLVVSPTQGWLTVDAPLSSQVIPHFAWRSVHGARCLYLWRCATEWGGMDYYHERVRSARCLGLWKCGWSKLTFDAPSPPTCSAAATGAT